jgi:cellulose synthase (UDP-forming)
MSNLARKPTASASPYDAEPAKPARHCRGVLWIRGLVLIALAASAYYFSWWSAGGRIASPPLALALLLAGVYHWAQILSSWVIYLAAARRPAPRHDLPVGWPTVDVFVTACGEIPDLVERALGAAVRMRGQHRTWLLDDGKDPRLERLSERLGAGYLTREGSKDAKAGNLNAALARTDGEIVVIFDVDHAPEPDFLERSIGPFSGPDVGFVQVMLSFANDRENWFARAASESCLDFFNPTSIGMDGLGGATLIGSNALIRRRALESIGGYKPGLAEDLATSLALHAGGWRSVYVAEPLAPGLAPADLNAWFTQQLKWARGVFEVLLTAYPRLVGRLSWGQRLSYGVRMTYYWVGGVAALHMLFTAGVLIGGERIARVDLQSYIVHFLPLVLATFAVRQAALVVWRHASVRPRFLWRAAALVYATWPVYALAWVMALLRVPLRFHATPKGPEATRRAAWLVPQLGAVALLGIALPFGAEHPPVQLVILFAFCALQALPQVVLLWQAVRAGSVQRVQRSVTAAG